METVRARKQGNAIMVTLSSKLAIEEGQEFYYFKDEKGIISLIPKAKDFFADALEKDFIDEEEDQLVRFFSPGGCECGD